MELFDEPIRDPEVLARAEMTFELYATAERIMRQNIRRRHPDLDEEEVEERLVAWLLRRPKNDFFRPSAKRAAKFGLRL